MMRSLASILLMTLSLSDSPAQDRSHAGSMTVSTHGIVAASQTVAAAVGARIIARGGNAVDAAIATNLALNVVEPGMNGMGGDLFAIVRLRDGRRFGLNASGWSAQALTLDRARKEGLAGVHSVTVPGAPAGWAALHQKFGKLPWVELFVPAIRLAEEGFGVTEIVGDQWKSAEKKLAAQPYSARTFLPGGKAPRMGELFRNPDLAQALRLLQKEGAKSFYDGPIAKAIVKTVEANKGLLSAADLKEFQPEWVEPIALDYRGWKVYEIPPSSQGIAVLSMLGMMERFPLAQFGAFDPQAMHLKIEAQKLAYQDLSRYIADPRQAKVPTQALLGKEYLASRAKLIDPQKANCNPGPGQPPLNPRGDTTYLAAIDDDGNMISLIQSIYQSFGSGIAVEPYGFHLHNRGALFSLDPQHPNAVAPRKRPFHTIIPGLMEGEGKAIAFGIMGGLNQAQAHAQFVSYLVDHRMNLQQAMDAPRFSKYTFTGCDVRVEARFPEDSRQALAAKGHALALQGAYSHAEMGSGQAVMLDLKTNMKSAASDPRKDGWAVPAVP